MIHSISKICEANRNMYELFNSKCLCKDKALRKEMKKNYDQSVFWEGKIIKIMGKEFEKEKVQT